MPRVGLMMIVKDEAHVVRRCLESARAFVDWWVVVDTGSTDGTQEVVRSALAGVPGELHERPWVDFGHNRQEALELARSSPHASPGDYACWIDADEWFAEVPAERPELTADGYYLTARYGATQYARLALVRLDRPWRWSGVIHETLDLEGAAVDSLRAPRVMVEHAGARSRDPETYRKDAALIERALRADPDDPRLQFYLAQSLRDAGALEDAVAAYRRRHANPAGWDQERWYSLFQIAVLRERLGQPHADVVEAHLEAYDACPWRAEPLVELARLERERGRFHAALLYARPATLVPAPDGAGIFVDVDAYTWRRWDELAVACYWAGHRNEGLAAVDRALDARPEDDRLRANRAWLLGLSPG